MASTTTNKSKLSEHGLNAETVVDIACLSDKAAWKHRTIPVITGSQPLSANSAYFVQNATTDHVLGPVGVACYLRAASISSARVASLGAGTFAIIAATTDGTTKTVLTGTIDPEGITANVGSAFTIAATNRALAATDVLFLRCVADNNTVTTDSSTVRVTVSLEPIAATTSTKTTGV